MVAYADYLMVITPPDSIAKEISRYKIALVNIIGHFEGMCSAPQIIITHQTRCKPFMMQTAIEKTSKRLSTMPPVELEINGFRFLNQNNAKTIYAKVEVTKHTELWFKLLTKQIGIKTKSFEPHIALAKNIPATAFNKLWPNFENR